MNGNQNPAQQTADRPAKPEAVTPAAGITPEVDDQVDGETLRWEASDASAQHKPQGWTMMMILGGLGVAIVVFIMTRSIFNVIAIIAAGAMFAYFNSRSVPTMPYQLDSQGIYIGNKHYSYSQFKSFAVAQETFGNHIVLEPLKRVMPSIVMYYPQEIESIVIKMLSDRMPLEVHKRDLVEALIRKLRF